mmetsp:Transcript_17684/g.37569  ORF Transcript_17684/g.37569 Transcript_17684/m.37569 type:complete len:311 (-) Transcript_17684:137-1069(-)
MGCTALKAKEDFHEKYSLGAKIGEGSCGQVRVVWPKVAKEAKAVKVLSLLDQRRLEAARRELILWRQAGRHPHCVELVEAFVGGNFCFMVMEKCDASLMDSLEEMELLPQAGIARLFRQMAKGLAHVHARCIVHRDVKPDNFLLGAGEPRTVKICDFGMSALVPKRAGELLTGCYGTAPYMSPEMISKRGHLQSTDVWSFGATAYVLLYGDFPFTPADGSSDAMKLAVLAGVPEPRFARKAPGVCGQPSKTASGFVRAVLERDPAQRSTIQEVQRLPFLQEEAPKVACSEASGGRIVGSLSQRWSRLGGA